MKTRRLVITATSTGFLVETDYRTNTSINSDFWQNLSRTHVAKFPLLIVSRVAHRADYAIFVRGGSR